jgi:hypothetical protein
MQAALRWTGWVQPGGRVEIVDPGLPAGKPVEVIVLFPPAAAPDRHSIADVLQAAPGQLMFQSAEEVEHYLRAEREAGQAASRRGRQA